MTNPTVRVLLLAAALALLAAPERAAARDCDVALKPTHSYLDLARMLTCLNDRISELEQQVAAGGGGGGSGGAATGAATGAGRVEGLRAGLDAARSAEKNGLTFAIDKCRKSERDRDDLVCEIDVINRERQDVEACLGAGSLVVTDRGAKITEIQSYVGARNAWGGVCDTVAPLVSLKAYVLFNEAAKAAQENIQLVRVDCGAGCRIEVYDEPIQ